MSSTVYHPGLTFATLVIQFVTASGGMISRLEPRRRGGENGEDPDPDGGGTEAAPATSQPPPPSSSSASLNKASSTSSLVNTTSSSSVSQSPTSLPSTTGASSTSLSSATTGASTSAFSSNSNGPTVLPAIAGVRSNTPTPVIVGSVIGAVVFGGLLVLLLTICRRRIRQAKKDPDAPLPVLFFSRSPRDQISQTNPEMSQTQSSPLIAPAVAAGLTSNPFMTRYSRSFHSSNSSPASASPLVPASSLPHHSNSVTSSSGRSTSHTTATSELDILQPPRGSPVMSAPSTLLPIITAAAEAAAQASPPSSAELSPLHRSLTMHQKALEADEKGQDDGHMEIEEIQGVNDPPPEYDA